MTVSPTLLAAQRRNLTIFHNQARGSSRPQLQQTATLNAMAQGWAAQMADKNYFNTSFCHPRPNGYSFFQWWNTKAPAAWRCTKTLCTGPCCPYYIGENIARYQRNASDVMNDWLGSPTHYKNIMNRSYRYMGIGIVASRRGDRYWVVQFFGDPTGCR
jgi:uncharacterized protein YkwD